ncbi:hypothetical protein [Reichenbachiella sp.]|uniref:hypothetical protein n=1 Tax=Reichenbachiella sp. TaxID=2184521 RepID=UPI003BAF14CA
MEHTPFIKITRHLYEEPYHVNLTVQISNGEQMGTLGIYDNADRLVQIANAMEGFPFNSKDFKWELGSEKAEDRFAFYFLFNLFISPGDSEATIHVGMNNNELAPEKSISEFFMTLEPAAINRLGELFRKFAELQHTGLYWNGSTGEVTKKTTSNSR